MATDFAALSADALLGIPADQPERLFKGIARLTAVDGRMYEIGYLRRHRFELGTLYVAGTVAAFEVERIHADLVGHAERAIQGLPYAHANMRKQVAPLVPAVPFAAAFQTATACVIVMRKPPGMLLLRDVLDHFCGRLDPRHVAWVVSSLLNLCCYFQHAGLTHNGLSLDTCFMAPLDHSISILGGWWYAAPAGARPLPGHPAPAAMVDWLRLPASDDPVDEYRTWQEQVLHDSFGARRFAELPLAQSDLYR